ncbi:hypothetical protein L3Q82_020639 [Scortum barcoo]|uniref:Uncharacterized protein n=1 Tax=Scortum barcoo TaxID=214431 RepID=A0ACB8V8F3_9TELE|nr:hypothetical protein L3Q82_020639 [Scortum barcoo]
MKESKCSVYIIKDTKEMSLHLAQPESNSEAPECVVGTTTTSNGSHVEHSFDESAPNVTESLLRQELQENDEGGTVATSKERSPRENERDDLGPSMLFPCSTSLFSSQDKAQHVFQREVLCSNLEQLELDKADSGHICFPDHSTPDCPAARLNPSEPSDLDSLSHSSLLNRMSQVDPTPMSEHGLAENTSEWQSEQVRADETSNSPSFLCGSISSEPPLSVSKSEDMDDGSGNGTYRGDLGIDSPLSFLWQEGSDGEQATEESRFDMDFRAASREDRRFVCPITLKKIMSGPAQALIDEEDEGLGAPEVLCRQSLSLVYSTIDEKYPEGTLQLLSDLLQPGFYPPKDITLHLLYGILLDRQCPYHLCVQAFNLLIRTQRHHMADKTTVAWDWDLLTSVIANQEHSKRHRCEVVRMLLEYVVQTLEDDFQAKRSISALHQSIAKATLSCDQRFPHVRDVIKWLFSAIVKSTEPGESKEAARERDEQIRMVSIFQRMLSLALEVDRSPALNSAKLSQELFHMLIGNIPLRAHRMLLLESLQSKLLRCKLLEHLLDYACPVKITVPMSLSLLLHFLKNCTLAPDPMDGTERWRRWEELVHLLWMLLLSYNKAMKGMPKEKYDPPDPRRMYTIMSSEEAANGKKSYWAELEISGRVRSLSTALWSLTHLTALHLSDNSLSRIPPDIAKLHNLVYLDLSSNKIRSLPAELGNMVSLRELLLNNNQLRVLPFELGKLFQLQTLGLKGNPLAQEIMSLYQEPDGTRRLLNYLLDNLAGAIKRIPTEQPPARSWISLQDLDRTRPSALFSVMCYNVLCDKYATRQLYGYCPPWALNWEYRKKSIMQEILGCNADIISLQEVETEQYYSFFLPELKEQGYDGFFSPKSRARTMSESDRKHVDGCAIFFKTEKFSAVQKHTVEFNQLAMANSEGSEAMLNRVMTKDNIGVAVLLEVRKEMMEVSSGKSLHSMEKQLLLVANAHMHWDPEYSDVKLVQTMMFLSEVKNIVDKATRSLKLSSVSGETNAIPLVLCADLNSLPDSGVVEYLSSGGVDCTHKDFKELRYSDSLTKFNCNGKNSTSNGRITHGFKLKSAYENGLMPYTNYTFDFKGVIDYIFYSKPHLNVLGILGPLDPHWLVENNVSGCPHPHIPSDHFSLFAQLELLLPPQVNGLHLPARR